MKKFIIDNFKNKKLRERLLFLHQEGLEDEEDLPMQSDSLKSFLSFVNYGLKLKEFGIAMGPNGTLCIGWRESDSKLINIKFINKESNYFIMYQPKEKPKDKFDKYRTIKKESVANIIRILKKVDWIFDK